MKGQLNIGRVFGVQLGLHYSWLVIAVLVTLSLAGNFSSVNAGWGAATIWTTAIVTGLLFFVTVILHELSHAVVAKSRGLPVRSITLFALGGIAQIDKEADDPLTEFLIGIAGPAMSIVIGTLCLITASTLGWSPETQAFAPQTPVLAALVWLGYINILLAIFNMIPGFPLDGGRVFRAIIWWASGDMNRSTYIAARIGQFVAVVFIVWGIFQFFFGVGFGGLWLALIGWFLLTAAGGSYANVAITKILRGLRVGDVMRRDVETIDGTINLQEFVDEHLLKTGSRCYFVVEGKRLVGMITAHEVKAVPRDEWTQKTIDQAMRTLDDLQIVSPQTPVSEALEDMLRSDVNQLPVADDNQLTGVITRNHILEILKTRADLKI